MSKKFTLVYWIKSKNIQTLETTKIPVASRYEGATVRLKYQENKNKTLHLDAQLIRMSNDKKELDELEVDEETGEVIDRTKKAFSKKILAQRVALIEEKKEEINRKRSVEKKREEEIIKNKSFLIDDSVPEKKIKSKTNVSKIGRTGTKTANIRVCKGETKKSINKRQLSSELIEDKTTSIKLKSREIDSSLNDENNEDDEILDMVSSKNVCFIPGVTTENLAFQKFILASMEYSLKSERGNIVQKMSKLTKEVLTNSAEKVEIYPNSGCFMSKSLFTSIDLLFEQDGDWKKLISNILVQMFGDNCKFMSVKGFRGNLKLHPKIWRSLFDLVNQKMETKINASAFNSAMNKVFSNRKLIFNKTIVPLDEKNEVDEMESGEYSEDPGKFDFANLSPTRTLPRSLSSSPKSILSTDLVIVDEEPKVSSEFTREVKSTFIRTNTPTITRSVTPYSDLAMQCETTAASTFTRLVTPPSTRMNTPSYSNSVLQYRTKVTSTITAPYSDPDVHYSSTITPTFTSTVTLGNFNPNIQYQTTSTTTYSNPNIQYDPTVKSTISSTVPSTYSNAHSQYSSIPGPYSNPHFQYQSTITPSTTQTVTHANSNPNVQYQTTVKPTISSTVTSTYSNAHSQYSSTPGPYSNPHSQYQSTITPSTTQTVTHANSNPNVQYQTTVKPTISSTVTSTYSNAHSQYSSTPGPYSNPHSQYQSTITPSTTQTVTHANSNPNDQYQPTVKPTISSTVTSTYSNAHSQYSSTPGPYSNPHSQYSSTVRPVYSDPYVQHQSLPTPLSNSYTRYQPSVTPSSSAHHNIHNQPRQTFSDSHPSYYSENHYSYQQNGPSNGKIYYENFPYNHQNPPS